MCARSRAVWYGSRPPGASASSSCTSPAWAYVEQASLHLGPGRQVARTALLRSRCRRRRPTSGAIIGSMSADHALEFSDCAMYTRPRSSLRQISTTRRSAGQIPSTKRTRRNSPSRHRHAARPPRAPRPAPESPAGAGISSCSVLRQKPRRELVEAGSGVVVAHGGRCAGGALHPSLRPEGSAVPLRRTAAVRAFDRLMAPPLR